MLNWKPIYAFSKHLILCDPENIELEKLDYFISEMEKHYRIYHDEISRVMMEGLRNFYNDCKNYKHLNEVVLKFEIYSRILRWIITRNNPRYLQVKFDEFRKAAKKIWIYLFGENFHEFWFPLPNKKYHFDKEVFQQWLEAVKKD